MKQIADNLTYTDRNGSFVLSGVLKEEYADPLDTQMLKAQQIPHLAKIKLQAQEGMISYEYDLGRRKPLSEWLRIHSLQEDQAIYLLLQATNMLLQLRNYLLIENRCLLTVDKMFIAEQPSDVLFIYCPDQRIPAAEKELALQIQRLCLDLGKLDTSDSRLIRQIVDYCADPLFNLNSLRKKLLTWIELQDHAVAPDSASQAGAPSTIRAKLVKLLRIPKGNNIKSREIATTTRTQEPSSRTIPLRAKTSHEEELKVGYLEIHQLQTGLQIIEIRRLPFVLGRASGIADWVLDDVKISRLHAEFRMTGDGLAIRDLGSSNGTFLNGERLIPFTDYPLQNQDQIRLAHIQCTYRYGSD